MLQSRQSMAETKMAEISKLTDQSLKQQGELQNGILSCRIRCSRSRGPSTRSRHLQGLLRPGEARPRISKLEKDVQSLKDQLQNKGTAPAQNSLYDSGMEKFKAGMFSDAVQDFKGFLAQNPDPALAGNAYFYMGESLYALGKYDDGILSYDTVVKKFKDSDKVPDALYKQGLSFMKMGDNETGTLILQQLIKEHPKTDAAKKAKKALKNPPA